VGEQLLVVDLNEPVNEESEDATEDDDCEQASCPRVELLLALVDQSDWSPKDIQFAAKTFLIFTFPHS